MSTHVNRHTGQQPIITFQIITDTHVTTDASHEYNLNFERALQDIAAHGQGSSGIMHIGDVTDHGFPQEYEEMVRIVNKYKAKLPDITFTLGNHDVGLGHWESRLALYEAETGMPGPYHDHWIDGYHFIFLGTEQGLPSFCDLSEQQLQWLEQKLDEQGPGGAVADWQDAGGRTAGVEAEGESVMAGRVAEVSTADEQAAGVRVADGRSAGEQAAGERDASERMAGQRVTNEQTAGARPVFLFLHQPLKDTVAGSLEAQEWYGVTQDQQLRSILAKFPQTLLFTGHTHWELEVDNTMFPGHGRTATMFNASSVAYLWTNEDKHKTGSQGYYVEVYSDRVVVRGRDFMNAAWIDSAQYEVALNLDTVSSSS
ncbi:metallophosphoesterase [Paenibacillus donghaensis]|uniref:Metallophosphoesterase n=2 Tax=Paenibacillus donghaensis TaxID=414771 RepID=A0A2Z2KW20_9BACL|nr:metallophosphoesterase [Paenibacillus donghaensis]